MPAKAAGEGGGPRCGVYWFGSLVGWVSVWPDVDDLKPVACLPKAAGELEHGCVTISTWVCWSDGYVVRMGVLAGWVGWSGGYVDCMGRLVGWVGWPDGS